MLKLVVTFYLILLQLKYHETTNITGTICLHLIYIYDFDAVIGFLDFIMWPIVNIRYEL